MAECAITEQTCVTGHYVLFTPDKGDKRFYALGSPPPIEQWAGTVQTIACKVEDVAADIGKQKVDGLLTWSPKHIAAGGGFLTPLHPVRIPITTGDAASVAVQIAKGGQTRVRTQIEVGSGVLTVDCDLDIWPPFRGLDAQRAP